MNKPKPAALAAGVTVESYQSVGPLRVGNEASKLAAKFAALVADEALEVRLPGVGKVTLKSRFCGPEHFRRSPAIEPGFMLAKRAGERKDAMQEPPAKKTRGDGHQVEDPLHESEVLALLNAPSRVYPTGIRNRAMFTVMYLTGLRVSEALALKPKDLDAARCTVRAIEGKNLKSRTVAMHPAGFDTVAIWMERRGRLCIPRAAPLFCTLQGTQLDASYVRRAIKRAGLKAGIERRVHPHALRHAYAQKLHASGVPVAYIQNQLGHSSLAITGKYLDGMGAQAAFDAVRAMVNWFPEAPGTRPDGRE